VYSKARLQAHSAGPVVEPLHRQYRATHASSAGRRRVSHVALDEQATSVLTSMDFERLCQREEAKVAC